MDAVFSHENHLYMIKVLQRRARTHHIDPVIIFSSPFLIYSSQDDQVFLYKVGEPHTHLDGYPKPVKEELGIEGPIDAAYVCEHDHIAHIIKGKTLTASKIT